jgi:hypothetical protein
MPRGAAPGERRGGRAKGTRNKYTQGQAWKRHRQTCTLDGALAHLSDLIAALVPDPQDRAALGVAIDNYIAARERELLKPMARDCRQRHKRQRTIFAGVPALLQLQVEPMELRTYELGIDIDALNDATRGLTGDALIDAVRSFTLGNAK